jgi:quercetin dioxygenase-like cupin family protein
MTDTAEYRPAVRNGAFRTAAPGRELKHRTGTGEERTMHVLAEAWQTNRRLSVALHELGPGEESALHMHSLEDEGFYVLEGEITFYMPHDDLVIEAGPGEFVWHPFNRAHSFKVGKEPVKLLQFAVPGTGLIPGLFADGNEFDLSNSEQRAAFAEKALREYGIRRFDSGDVPASHRPRQSRGPLTPDARILMPEEVDRKLNVPFRSDPNKRFTLNIDRGVMTGVELIYHAWGHQTADLFELIELAWTKPDIVFPHVHTWEEEGFYVLEGEFTLYVAEPDGVTKQVARAGDFVWGPRDYPHYYHISGSQGARVLTCFVPGGSGFLKFFYGVAVEGRGADLSTDEKLKEFQEWQAPLAAKFYVGPDEWPGEFPTPIGGGSLV